MPDDKKDDGLGALWEKETASGAMYMTGTIQGVRVVVFRNRKKTQEKQPDWRVLKSTPKPASDPAF